MFKEFLESRFWLLAALLVSLWLVLAALISDPVLNRDGMYYIDQARLLLSGGDFHDSRWTVFSRFLASGAEVFSVDPYVIGLVFIVVSRILITALMFFWLTGMNRRIEPSLVFVVAVAMPWMIDYQSFLLRDTAAWATLIACLVCSERWTMTRNWRWLLAMPPLICLAVFMRTEMLMLLVLAGWLVLLAAWKKGPRLLLGVAMLSGVAVALVVAAGWKVIHAHVDAYLAVLSGTSGYQLFPDLVEALAPHVNVHARDELPKVLAVGLFSLPIFAVAELLGIFIVPAVYALASPDGRRSAIFDQGAVLWLMLAFLLVLLVFVFAMQFLSGRYAVPLAICMTPWVAHGLERMWRARPRAARVVVTVALVMAVAGSITTTSTKYLMRDLGTFVAEHEHQVSPVFFNDARVAFYAGEPMKSAATGPLPDEPAALVEYESLAVAFDCKPEEAATLLDALQDKYGFSRTVYFRQDGRRNVALLVR